MPIGAWGLSDRRVPDPSVVLRVADAVVTDDADEAVDFLLTGRPLLHYLPAGRPGRRAARLLPARRPPCRARAATSFDELTAALDSVFEPPDAERSIAYRRAVDLAFAHTDDLSGWRLVERLRRQYVDG